MPQSRRIAVVLLLCAATPRIALAQAQFIGPDGTHMSGVVIECQGPGAPSPCGSTHTPLVTIDGGVAGTGLLPPAGGSGDLGFLSGILGALSNTLSVTVTNMSGALPAGNNALGSVSVSNLPSTQMVSGTIADSNSAAFQGVVAITPGIAVTAARSLGYICTASGNVTLTLADSSTIILPITAASTSFQTLPFAVTNVSLGTGAAGTFWNLK